MKKIFLFLGLVVSAVAMGQVPPAAFPLKQTLGSKSTLVVSNGGLAADSVFMLPVFTDTLRANKGPNPKYYPGDLIRTGDSVWMRSADASKWLLIYSITEARVDTIYRTAGKDSIQFTIGGRYHAIKDSVGVTPTYYNSNVGSGYRLAIPNTNNIKTVFTTSPVTIDSTTNTNALTIGLDTSAGKWRSENYYNTIFTPLTRTLNNGYGIGSIGNFTANRTVTLDSATVFPNLLATIALTTAGTGGAATWNPTSRILNIPQYQAAGTYVTNVTATYPASSSGGTTPNISLDTSSGKWRSENYYNTIYTPLTRALNNGYGVNTIGNFTTDRTVSIDSATVFANLLSTIAITTTGTSGAATWNPTARILNIPQYTFTETTFGTVTGVSAGNGMNFTTITASGPVNLATPLNVTLSSTNDAGGSGTGHTHAFVPGGTTLQYIRGDGTLATLPIYTANSGLTMTTNNTQLGGPLLNNPTISGSTNYGVAFTGSYGSGTNLGVVMITQSGTNGNGLYVTNDGTNGNAIVGIASSGGNGIRGIATAGQGIEGDATSGVGVYASATTGYGIQSYATSTGVSALFSVNPSSTNTIVPVVEVTRGSSGSAANGIGGSVDFKTMTTTANQISNSLVSKWTDVTNATRTSQFIIRGVNSATTGDLLTLSGNGAAKLNNYGSGTFTGTPTYNLSVDASGNVIEVAPSSGITDVTATDLNGFDFTVTGTTTKDISLAITPSTNQVLFANSGALSGDADFTFDGSLVTVFANNLGVTQSTTKGLLLDNTQAASSGNQQISPAIYWSGNGWKTDGTAASRSVDFRAFVLPVEGASNPTGTWTLQSSINGGSFGTAFAVTSTGEILDGGGSPGSGGSVLTSNGAGGGMAYRSLATLGAVTSVSGAGLITASGTNSVTVSSSLAQNKLAGRGATSGTGIFEAIDLGSGLSMTGTTLSATDPSATNEIQNVTGTSNRIDVSGGGGMTPTVDISSSYVGQSSITTLGTITTGVWNGTDIAYANIAQLAAVSLLGNPNGSTADVQGITLGSGLSFVGSVLTPADASATNEIQTFSSSTSDGTLTWTLASGGSLTLTAGDNVVFTQGGTSQNPTVTINAYLGMPMASVQSKINEMASEIEYLKQQNKKMQMLVSKMYSDKDIITVNYNQ